MSESYSNAKELDEVGNMKQKIQNSCFQLYPVRHRAHRIPADISKVLNDAGTFAHSKHQITC